MWEVSSVVRLLSHVEDANLETVDILWRSEVEPQSQGKAINTPSADLNMSPPPVLSLESLEIYVDQGKRARRQIGDSSV